MLPASQFIATAERQLYIALLERAKYRPIANDWLANLPKWLGDIKDKRRYAHAPAYASAVEKLPSIKVNDVGLNADAITIHAELSESQQRQITALMRQLMPWRKGPFQIGTGEHNVYIDCEWRSDFKWQRIAPKLSEHGIYLTDRHILDVGGGSGYHGFRMLGAGANQVMVIDPSCLFYHQFMAIRHFVESKNTSRASYLEDGYLKDSQLQDIHFIPVGLEDLPSSKDAGNQLFDVVFCMGVLYHRASPFEHLHQLRDQLQAGGHLILETLVVDGDATTVLVPPDRYAMMNNVYFLPSVSALTLWLEKVGFTEVQCIDVSTTTPDEQRATAWMDYQSLVDFLDTNDPSKTAEGHPAPKRATLIAKK